MNGSNHPKQYDKLIKLNSGINRNSLIPQKSVSRNGDIKQYKSSQNVAHNMYADPTDNFSQMDPSKHSRDMDALNNLRGSGGSFDRLN